MLSGGEDPTGGSTHWDGQDFLKKGLKHNKFKEYGWVIIMEIHLDKFIESQENLYGTEKNHCFDKTCTPDQTDGTWGFSSNGYFWSEQRGTSKTYYNLYSSGAEGGTLFWKAEEKPKPSKSESKSNNNE